MYAQTRQVASAAGRRKYAFRSTLSHLLCLKLKAEARPAVLAPDLAVLYVCMNFAPKGNRVVSQREMYCEVEKGVWISSIHSNFIEK
jgi:hypothetical protein